MAIKISRTVVEQLGFDLTEAVSAFKQELAAHAKTVNVAAPTSHPVVEAIVRSGDGHFLVVDEESPTQAPLTRIAKADVWRRLTDDEAEALDAALAASPVRLRRIFEAAQFLDITDPDYPALRIGVVAALGEARADEVLAPTY